MKSEQQHSFAVVIWRWMTRKMMTMSKMREEIMREREREKKRSLGAGANNYIIIIMIMMMVEWMILYIQFVFFFCWWNETRFGSVTHTQWCLCKLYIGKRINKSHDFLIQSQCILFVCLIDSKEIVTIFFPPKYNADVIISFFLFKCSAMEYGMICIRQQ